MLFSLARRMIPTSLLPQPPLEKKLLPDGSTYTDVLMAATAQEAEAQAEALSFPPDFLFGAATAAYQVEGGLYKCNWAAWERAGHNGGHYAGAACDHWSRFEEDVEHMKALGLRMYRFSVDWSRCEPAEGVFDAAAIERYASWCKLLRASGIEPMITLHHFVHPEWFDERGGWEKADNVAYFRRFAQRVCAQLCAHCAHWCTLNELNGYAMCGWVAGVHPPGRRDDAVAMVLVIKNMLLAHTAAVGIIRAECAAAGVRPTVTFASSHILFTASPGWRPFALLSAVVAVLASYLFNLLYWDALLHGRVW